MNKTEIFNFSIVLLMVCYFFSCVSSSQSKVEESKERASWNLIEPYFSPLSEFEGEFGEYRTPLKFYDGTNVETPQDWQKRREEILYRWHGMMGEWPPMIKNHQVEILETTRRENFTQHYIKFNWRPSPNESTKGYLLIPDGEEKKPAVITVFYEPETAIGLGSSPHRDFAYQLAKRGFVTLSIGTNVKGDRSPPNRNNYYPNIDNAQIQPLSMNAYFAANAWQMLAQRTEVDSTRIGIVGHSYGGKWAMFASSLFDKFAASVWSDPGIVFDESRGYVNYWEPWYLGYHSPPWRERGMITESNEAKGLYVKLVTEGYDLHELHALHAPRPFLVSGGSEDPPERWVPLNHTIEVNRLLGYENRVAMTNRSDHSPNVESNEHIYNFFEYFLKE